MNREPIERSAAPLPQRLADWKGTDRYQVRRCIGAGSMGTVYEAFDRDRGQPVALKRLRHFSPATLYLFKQEFRTLVDLHHPNLVRLHELVATEEHDVFFTMELVRGSELLAHVRPKGVPELERLRDALRQLAQGVHALHASGKLHRDIKPSNVLVTSEGRVVLLDFGVATELSRGGDARSRDQGPIVGTASYMAPEQASGDSPTPGSDWYSVGAILFEALVGEPPFVGSIADVLRMKRSVDARPPAECAAGVPPDLDALCGALLKRSGALRPSGPEILRWLGASRVESAASTQLPRREGPDAPRLIGRSAHLDALNDALVAAQDGRSIAVFVSGSMGMGKSSLVQEFLDDVAARGGAVVLRARAYERESVPYKAVDGWVDALSRFLLRLSDEGAQVPLPDDVWALARLFPVLRRVPEIADVRERIVGDPQRLRRLAFGALRELLASIAKRHTLVIYVDDAHWGDTDSAAVYLDLVRPPGAPPLLLVMTHREGERASGFLTATWDQWPQGAETREIIVGPLDAEDARRLALSLLGSDAATAQATAEVIARESLGSPFLVEELVRDRGDVGTALSGSLTLEQSVRGRLEPLAEAPRRLLQVVAVGGRPLAVSIAGRAAGVVAGLDDAVALLRTMRLVRTGLRGGQEVVETTHDRIAEAIVGGLPADRVREHHRDLAQALEATPDPDPEAVALHWVGAGDRTRAGPYAERAAEQAIGKLAFDRAVQLFRSALEAVDPASAAASSLRIRLAEALAWAGRGEQAALAYFEAAADARGLRRLELERAAAEQLLASGHIDEGAEALHRVLGAMGMKAPRSTLSALFWLLVYRAWIALTRLRFVERAPEDVSHEDRVRVETMYSVAMGFAIVDVLLGACVQARLLILALRAGDRHQVLRAAAIEAAQRASSGGAEGKRERALIDIARSLAAKIGGQEAEGLFEGAIGIGLFLRGRWREARTKLEASNAKLVVGRTHWHANGNLFITRSLYYAGDFKELVRRHAHIAADAEDRRDLYTIVNLATTTTITTHLVADDPEAARRDAREALKEWSQSGFLVQQWQAMVFEPDIDMYDGDGGAAYERFARDLPALKKSFLLHAQVIRAITFYAHGRCAVASLESRPALRRSRISEARRAARRLASEGMPWIMPLSSSVTAAVNNAEDNREGAVAGLRATIAGAEAAGMRMHAIAARHRLGELLGGESGAALSDAAARAMTAEGIKNPAGWLAIFFPGRWR